MDDPNASRRSFLKGGAIIAAPFAVGAPAAAIAADNARQRLARLEDEQAIRSLHQSWMRHVTSGDTVAAVALFAQPHISGPDENLRAVAPDHTGTPDRIEIAPDGLRATACFACTVERATLIPPTSTLAQMAHAQGEGHVRETIRALISADYVKTRDGWAIARLGFGPA